MLPVVARRLSGAAGWLDRHTHRAPAALRSRVAEYAASADPEGIADSLAAGLARLDPDIVVGIGRVPVEGPGDRTERHPGPDDIGGVGGLLGVDGYAVADRGVGGHDDRVAVDAVPVAKNQQSGIPVRDEPIHFEEQIVTGIAHVDGPRRASGAAG